MGRERASRILRTLAGIYESPPVNRSSIGEKAKTMGLGGGQQTQPPLAPLSLSRDEQSGMDPPQVTWHLEAVT